MLRKLLQWKSKKDGNEDKVVKRLNKVIPTFEPKLSLWIKIKKFLKMAFWQTTIVVIIAVLCVTIFVGYRIVKNRGSFLYHLKEKNTVAIPLSSDYTLQSLSIQEALDKLTSQDAPLRRKLAEIAAEGYEENWYNKEDLVIYDEKERKEYRQLYEEKVLTAIEQTYKIYNNFDATTERKVYGITSDELVYQKNLAVQDYTPATIKHALFEGRRYFPFALIAGKVAEIDPLRILKIFEIETEFSEIAVGKNSSSRRRNFDIGLGQNNLIVVPGLIRDILDPKSPVYSPVFEFMTVCQDIETKKMLTWSEYLPRLEKELKGNYDKTVDPTGEYYINALKAPHICAFLVAYHIKRDQLLSCYSESQKFYENNSSRLKKVFKLDVDINPTEWTDYTTYNGGPLRWQLVRKYLEKHSAKLPISTELEKTVRATVRRNMQAQKIAKKNQSLRKLVYDKEKDKLVKNGGESQYGLYDFTLEFKRSLLYNLKKEVNVVKEKEQEANMVKGRM